MNQQSSERRDLVTPLCFCLSLISARTLRVYRRAKIGARFCGSYLKFLPGFSGIAVEAKPVAVYGSIRRGLTARQSAGDNKFGLYSAG